MRAGVSAATDSAAVLATASTFDLAVHLLGGDPPAGGPAATVGVAGSAFDDDQADGEDRLVIAVLALGGGAREAARLRVAASGDADAALSALDEAARALHVMPATLAPQDTRALHVKASTGSMQGMPSTASLQVTPASEELGGEHLPRASLTTWTSRLTSTGQSDSGAGQRHSTLTNAGRWEAWRRSNSHVAQSNLSSHSNLASTHQSSQSDVAQSEVGRSASRHLSRSLVHSGTGRYRLAQSAELQDQGDSGNEPVALAHKWDTGWDTGIGMWDSEAGTPHGPLAHLSQDDGGTEAATPNGPLANRQQWRQDDGRSGDNGKTTNEAARQRWQGGIGIGSVAGDQWQGSSGKGAVAQWQKWQDQENADHLTGVHAGWTGCWTNWPGPRRLAACRATRLVKPEAKHIVRWGAGELVNQEAGAWGRGPVRGR